MHRTFTNDRPNHFVHPKPQGGPKGAGRSKNLGGGGTNLRLFISAYVLFYLIKFGGGTLVPPDSETPGGPVDGRHFEVLSRLNLHCKNVFDINISSVVEFQRWWVLKSKVFGQE